MSTLSGSTSRVTIRSDVVPRDLGREKPFTWTQSSAATDELEEGTGLSPTVTAGLVVFGIVLLVLLLLREKGTSVSRADRWLLQHRLALAGAEESWADPLQNQSPWGEDVFEWWYGSRKLTVYVRDDGAEFVKVWGPNMNTEMESGDLSTPNEFVDLWRWLHRA